MSWRFWQPTRLREVEDELEFHVDMRTRELVARGMTPEAARTEALRRLGDLSAMRRRLLLLAIERDRIVNRAQWLREILHDVRLAGRSLVKEPAVMLVVIVSLALGIGGVTTSFSVVHGVLLRAVPYRDPGRLVVVEEIVGTRPSDRWELAYPTFDDVRSRARSFAGLAGYLGDENTMSVGEETVPLATTLVTPNAFALLEVSPALGRVLVPADGEPGAAPVAVMSHRLWAGRFGSDPGIIGRALPINGSAPLTIVGVMPAGFFFPDENTQLWTAFRGPESWMRNRAVHLFKVIARLNPGVTSTAAARELTGILSQLQQENPGSDPGHTVAVTSFQDRLVGNIRLALLVLFGAVAAVTLIVAVNIASVLLARGLARRGELAVRAALGAGRGRISRQLLIESLVLAGVGGAAGLAAAFGGVRWVAAHLPAAVPRGDSIGLEAPVLIFALAVTLATGIVFGLAPALHGGRADPADVLRRTQSRAASGRGMRRLQSGFVITQLALAQLLLVGAGLLLHSFVRLQQVEAGFDPSRMLTLTVSLPGSRYDATRRLQFLERLPDRLTAIKGVEAASATSALPISGGDSNGDLTIEGRPFVPGTAPGASFRRALPNYFRTMGIPLVAGRDFTAADRGDGAMVVIISESMMRRFWPSGDALGKRIKIGPAEHEPWLTIVGVVGNVHNVSLEADGGLATYEPLAQRGGNTVRIVVRTAGDPLLLAAAIRQAVRDGDASLPVTDVASMDQRIAASLSARRFNTTVLTGLGLLAVVVAAVGVFGLTTQSVAAARRELGIRLALGATPGEVVRLVVGRAGRLAITGCAIGLASAWAGTRLLQQLLFATRPADPAAVLGASATLAALCLLAALLPAWGGARTDPVRTLREE